MPIIKPILDLRNYAEVVNEVSYGHRVYLDCNKYGSFANIYTWKLDESEK